MAKDDINVIMYKILRYLYECKKAGIRPSEEDIVYNSKLLNIPRLYWEDVILELGEKGFINGIQKRITKDFLMTFAISLLFFVSIRMKSNPSIALPLFVESGRGRNLLPLPIALFTATVVTIE